MESISNNLKKQALGELEATLLDLIQNFKGPGIRLEDARRLAPWPTSKVQAAFKRLVSKGRLVRFARGHYYLTSQDPARVACHAWAPSYVSFLTVLADAGFTDQIPRRLDLAYARSNLRRKAWGALPITWHPIPVEAFSGYRPREDGALIATPAKAAADLVHRQRDFGGITPYRIMTEAALRRRPTAEVDAAIEAYESHSGTLRRLLYLKFANRPLPPTWKRRVITDLHNPLRLDPARRDITIQGGRRLNILEVVD